MSDAKAIVKEVSKFIEHEKSEVPKLQAIKTVAQKLVGKHAEPMRHHKETKR